MVNKYRECGAKPCDWSMAEFFVAYPYRKKGVGTAALEEVFARHPGDWQIMYHPKNTGGAAFWRRAAERAAKGPVETAAGDETPYADGSPAQVLCFRV